MLASEVHFPEDTGKALALLDTVSDPLVFAGGSGIMRAKADRIAELPFSVVCIHRITELRRINRSEGLIELGACVTLASLETAPVALPPFLLRALGGIGVRPIRNIATLGGNLACPQRFMTLWPILASMDASVELREKKSSRWVNINRLVSDTARPALPERALLTRVRVSLEPESFAFMARTGPRHYPARESASFVCTARLGSGSVERFRLIHAGERCFRSREMEAALSGRKLPLSERESAAFAGEYVALYQDFLKKEEGEASASTGSAPPAPQLSPASDLPEFRALAESVFSRLSRSRNPGIAVPAGSGAGL